MWDIKEHEERIKNPRGDHRDKDLFIVSTISDQLDLNKFLCTSVKPGFEDENFFQTPHIRFCAVSNIEQGHTEPISDLQWIPDHYQVYREKLEL